MCELFIKAEPNLWQNTTKSIRMQGQVTSIRLENHFWMILVEIAARDSLSLPQLLLRLYDESVEEGHDMVNFASFLRVCCTRYQALQLSQDIPQDENQPIGSLDARQILQNEQERRATKAVC
ncbi:ribbon-helix-helix domain-containing protein [Polycladidibacter hongkongensis]|uniref:ribbon-helix-helix domain-containing protein n=1 Tax=Polycladidibacter hongkongensis TaxID=1647556 RepID=UPI00082B24FE|nr:ribbon-helix-helix domain-containing protein [Pseudovibrio hongkongensis]